MPKRAVKTLFGDRFYDVRTSAGVGVEAKLGRTSLSKFVSKRLAKDVAALRAGDVSGVVWVFGKSPVTGLGGPTKPLEQKLEALQRRLAKDGLGFAWRVVP